MRHAVARQIVKAQTGRKKVYGFLHNRKVNRSRSSDPMDRIPKHRLVFFAVSF